MTSNRKTRVFALFAVILAVFGLSAACISKFASKEASQRAGRDAMNDQSTDIDALDAKNAQLKGIDASKRVAGVTADTVTGENIINVIAGGPVEPSTLADWLVGVVGILGVVGTVAMLLGRAWLRLRGIIRELIDIIERFDRGDTSRSTLKDEIAKHESRKTPLGRYVRRQTRKG